MPSKVVDARFPGVGGSEWRDPSLDITVWRLRSQTSVL
jgi:hypothetical protein